MMDDLIGHCFGTYRLVRLISKRGASADVYEGEHVHDQTKAAVKVWKIQIEVKTFLNDVRAAVLRHPHILKILDFDIKNDVPYLVMEYAPNGSLQAQPLPLSLATTVDYVQQIADALSYAHERGFIHRDIKPDNILLGPNNQIWVGDFGIATPTTTRQDTLTNEPDEQIAGTAGYMAPEQWQGKPSRASDQYALGVMVYEWLCGECPFSGKQYELLHQHITVSPPPLREKNPTISPAIEEVVMRTLEKDPANRFPDVQAFAQALKQASSPPPSGREPLYSRQPSLRKARRVSPLSTTRVSYTKHTAPINAVAWSPDGRYIASVSDDQTMQVWNAHTSDVRFTTQSYTGALISVVWSPDGKYIASVSKNKSVHIVHMWDTEPFTVMPPLLSSIETVAWSPDSKYIACIDQDGHIEIWDVLNERWDGPLLFSRHPSQSLSPYGLFKKSPFELEAENANWTVAWSPDGRWIASYESRNATMVIHELLDYKGSPRFFTPSHHMKELAWSADSKYLTVAHFHGQQVTVWDWNSIGKAFVGPQRPFNTAHTGAVLAAAWPPDGKYIASGGKDATIQIWDQRDKICLYTYRGHTKAVRTIAWSPHGNTIASGSEDATVNVWGVPTE